MAESVRTHPSGAGLDWRHWPEALARLHRGAAALVVALTTLIVFLAFLSRAPLAVLPDYASVGATLFVALVLPGLIIQGAVLPARADLLTRLAVAPALGLAVLALPGFLALEAHVSLQEFEILYAFFAASLCGVAVLFYGAGPDDEAPVDVSAGDERSGSSLLLFAMAFVVIGGVLTTPLWASNRLSADFDDWTYMAYVRDFLDTDRLNAEEPFLGTGEGVNPRMRDNVWVLSQAMISDASGVAPRDVMLQYEPPMLAVCALLAMYALTRALFAKRTIALLAVLFEAGYGLLDFSAHEGFGRNLFLRIGEDKMVSGFILFPVGLVFLTRFLTSRSWAAYAGFVLVVLALTFVHPVPLVFLGTALVAMTVLRFVLDRDWRVAIPPALLAVPVGLGAVWPFIQRQLLVDVAPDLFESEASSITFRDEFHVVDLGHGILMGNFHMVLHPLVIAAVLLVPFVWLAARRSTGHQLVLAMTCGALFVFFAPFVATPVAKLMTPQTLWKMPWMIPTAPILAFAAYRAAGAVASWRPAGFVFAGRRKGAVAAALLPGLAVCLVLAAAVAVLDQYSRVDDKSFYNWASEDTVVPGTSESIFRGGLDRAFVGSWRLDDWDRELFAALDDEVPRGSVVLAEPLLLNRYIPGVLGDVAPIDFGGTAGEGQRRIDAVAFAHGELTAAQVQDLIARYGVDYIVLTELGPAASSVEPLAELQLVHEIGPYQVLRVLR